MTSFSGDQMSMARVIYNIIDERFNQDERWGQQNHPDGTGYDHFRVLSNDLRNYCDEAADAGQLKWADILREEVYEALAESDPVKLREELIQVAAVAVAWVEAIDRRQA